MKLLIFFVAQQMWIHGLLNGLQEQIRCDWTDARVHRCRHPALLE